MAIDIHGKVERFSVRFPPIGKVNFRLRIEAAKFFHPVLHGVWVDPDRKATSSSIIRSLFSAYLAGNFQKVMDDARRAVLDTHGNTPWMVAHCDALEALQWHAMERIKMAIIAENNRRIKRMRG